jgi:hypothetical protein
MLTLVRRCRAVWIWRLSCSNSVDVEVDVNFDVVVDLVVNFDGDGNVDLADHL